MRLFLAIALILIVLPQTSFDNVVIRRFHESGLFANYAEAKQIVFGMTWRLLFAFLGLHLYLAMGLARAFAVKPFGLSLVLANRGPKGWGS